MLNGSTGNSAAREARLPGLVLWILRHEAEEVMLLFLAINDV